MSLPNGISIVICTYNGVSRLQPTLESIFSLKIRDEISWELIIVDNASNDGTSSFCKSLIDKYDFQEKSRIVFEEKAGCNNARLRGLQETRYKWLLFCDDDNHLFPDYIEKAWSILQFNPNIGVLGGQGVPLFETEKPVWFDQYSRSFAIGPQAKKEGELKNKCTKLYSAGSFFRKEVLMFYYDRNFKTIMVGPKGDDLTRGEDTEWCFLIQLQGYSLWYSNDLKFYHFMTKTRMTWEYYLKLKKGISSGAAKMESYSLFFRRKNPSNISFLLHYFKLLIYYNFIWFQFRWRSKLQSKRYSQKQLQLGKVVNYTRAISFRNHFKVTFSHFIQLKKILFL